MIYYAYDTDFAGRVVSTQEFTEDESTHADHNGLRRTFTTFELVGMFDTQGEAYAA